MAFWKYLCTTLVVSIAAQVTVMATTERMKIGGRREISLKVLKSSHLRRQKVLKDYVDGNLKVLEVHLNLQNVFALSTRAMERLQGFKACKTVLRGHMARKDFHFFSTYFGDSGNIQCTKYLYSLYIPDLSALVSSRSSILRSGSVAIKRLEKQIIMTINFQSTVSHLPLTPPTCANFEIPEMEVKHKLRRGYNLDILIFAYLQEIF